MPKKKIEMCTVCKKREVIFIIKNERVCEKCVEKYIHFSLDDNEAEDK
jgi:hypothetical protein